MQYHCPSCHNSVELTNVSSGEVPCPVCGSTFRLEGFSTVAWAPAEGQRVGRFEVLGVVGAGAFGTVYRARDPELDRVVAVKVPRAGRLAAGQDLDRFLREARSVAQLRHPGIVPVHEAGQADGVPYLVSEFVQGVTLADLLSARRPPPAEAARLAAALADALHYAHENGLVHRDVKPSNILLDEKGQPRLMDFGLARRDAGEVTMTVEGQVLGTPAYMPPEQARGEAHGVDGRSDVYSLGVVLYQMLTGELPFRGTARMLLHQVLNDEPRRPRSLNDRVPRDLETVCLRAMAKEPARRYASARELADDLRRSLAGEPIRARPAGAWERGWRWVRRRPAAAALIGVSGVAALALAALAVAAWHHRELRAAYLGEAAARERAEQARADEAQARREEEGQRRKAEASGYLYGIALASLEFRDGNVGRADRALDDCPPGPRRWEWHYLRRLCRADLLTVRPAGQLVTGLAFSPDGRRLAGATRDNAVLAWDADTGREALALRGHTGAVFAVAFSPDGRQLASASADRTVRIWDSATGQPLLTLRGHKGPVFGVAFTPDGRLLASGSADRTVKLWDAAGGKEVRTLRGHQDVVLGVAVSRTGLLASASADRTVRVWGLATGELLRSCEGHQGEVTGVAFSPDGGRLASASADRTVWVWDAATGRPLLTLRGPDAGATAAAYSPGGDQVAGTFADGSVRVWDAATGREAPALRGHGQEVTGLAFRPDGRALASASYDGTVRLWDARPDREAVTLRGHNGAVAHLAFSPDGRTLASAGADASVKLWGAGAGRELRSLEGHTAAVSGVAFSPDGARLASICPARQQSGSADLPGQVKVWEVASGRELLSHPVTVPRAGNVAFSPDGKRLVWAAGTLKSADLTTAQAPVDLGPGGDDGEVVWVGFTRDGGRLVSLTARGEARVRDPADGRVVRSVPATAPGPLGGTPGLQGRFLAVPRNGQALVWDTESGECVLTVAGHSQPVRAAALSPGGERLVTASEDRTIKVWDVATGREVLTLRGHAGAMTAAEFSPDGARLATASADGTVKLWDGSPPPATPADRSGD